MASGWAVGLRVYWAIVCFSVDNIDSDNVFQVSG